MTISYETWRMRYAVRKPSEIFRPRLVPIINFPGMPWGSILHYVGEGMDDYGPSIDNLFLRSYKTAIFVDTVLQPKTMRGNPRKVAVNINSMVKSFHAKNFRMRPLRKWDTAVMDKRAPIVVNYAMFPYTMRYINNYMMVYNRWFNQYSTVWSKINEIATKYDRMNYLVVNLPTEMVSISDLRRAESMLDDVSSMLPEETAAVESFDVVVDDHDIQVSGNLGLEAYAEHLDVASDALYAGVARKLQDVQNDDTLGLEALTRSMLETLMSNELLTLLDLWTWMGANRERSLMSMLSPESLARINLCFVEGGRITSINLGMLDKMRASETNTKGFPPKQAQRLFLKYIDSVFQLRSQKSAVDIEVDHPDDEPETEAVDSGAVVDPIGKTDSEIEGYVPPEFEIEEDLTSLASEINSMLESDSELETPSKEEKTIHATLAAPTDKLSEDTVRKLQRHRLSPEEIIRIQADELAESGAITAQDYRRINKLSERYKTLPNPFNRDETLEQAMTIPEELLQLPADSRIPVDLKGVPDKSMLGNTLQVMQDRYIRDVLHKDNLNAIVQGFQMNGVMVNSIKVDRARTYMDEYDTYTIQLVPTRGSPSTVRMKIPHVRADGTIKSNGVVSRLNSQRGDFNTL